MKRKIKIFITIILIVIFGIGIYFYLPPILADNVYPLEYRDLIKKHADDWALDPNFVAAVIYSESHFNAQATSPVGARGLMQIMPRTGLGIARRFGEESTYSPDKLYDPDFNIRYGCWYLRDLMFKYNDNVELTLIAYNGGVALADRYAVRPGNLNAETSYYRVKVQKAKEIYDQLYGKWWLKSESEKEKPKKPTLTDLIMSWLLGRG